MGMSTWEERRELHPRKFRVSNGGILRKSKELDFLRESYGTAGRWPCSIEMSQWGQVALLETGLFIKENLG